MPVDTKKPRRSQAERAAEMKERLCQATLVCLGQLGYKHTSISAIVKLAGATIGARLHHYPYKIDLVEAAFEYHFETAIARSNAFLARSGRVTMREFIDFIWEDTYRGASFPAVVEALVAARVDEDLRTRLTPLFERWYSYQETAFRGLFNASCPGLPLETLLSSTTALFRGVMIAQTVQDDQGYSLRIIELWHEMLAAYAAAHGHVGDLEAVGPDLLAALEATLKDSLKDH